MSKACSGAERRAAGGAPPAPSRIYKTGPAVATGQAPSATIVGTIDTFFHGEREQREMKHIWTRGLLASAAALSWSGPAAALPLNDTGMVQCVDATGQFTSNCVATGQDGETGRDVTASNALDGDLGFSYAKVCNNGQLAGTGTCPANPKQGTSPTTWGCTLDQVTGLLWELKLDNPGGSRDQNARFTNARPDQSFYGKSTDAQGYVTGMNDRGLCGSSDWRMPTYHELISLVHYGRKHPATSIDPTFFPNTGTGLYWTSSAYAERSDDAWYVGFVLGQAFPDGRNGSFHVRLVRAWTN